MTFRADACRRRSLQPRTEGCNRGIDAKISKKNGKGPPLLRWGVWRALFSSSDKRSCRRSGSNRYSFRNRFLRPARLPIPPLRHSGRSALGALPVAL